MKESDSRRIQFAHGFLKQFPAWRIHSLDFYRGEKQPSRSRQGVSCMFSKSWFHEAWGKLIPKIASNDDIQDIFVITQYSKSLYCYVQSSFTFLWCSLKISKSFKETLFKFNYIWVTCYRLVVNRKVLMCSLKNII